MAQCQTRFGKTSRARFGIKVVDDDPNVHRIMLLGMSEITYISLYFDSFGDRFGAVCFWQ